MRLFGLSEITRKQVKAPALQSVLVFVPPPERVTRERLSFYLIERQPLLHYVLFQIVQWLYDGQRNYHIWPTMSTGLHVLREKMI
jgi:hypothetical protein